MIQIKFFKSFFVVFDGIFCSLKQAMKTELKLS